MTDAHSAAGPALGYQYQADYCLFELMNNAGPGRSISLELHDDVAWDEAGTPIEKLQLKHKVNSIGGLGDRSEALWRTLKVWMDAGSPANLDGPSLVLVSTGTAAVGSAAYALRRETRNAAAAADALRTVAATDEDEGNQATAVARAQFARMSVPDQNAFVSRITVVDGQPTVTDLDAAIQGHLYLHMPDTPEKQQEFMASLWGWWRGRVVEMLSRRFFPDQDLRDRVASSELRDRLRRLAIAYSDQGLPEYEEFDVDHGDAALAGLDNELFVRQLNLVAAHQIVIRRAIVDYYRATSSETRWLERDALRTDEVVRYERRLQEAWDVAFGLMVSAMGSDATDSEQAAAGHQLLTDVLTSPAVRIREQVDQDFYYRGKHHMLAQRGSVGWHPDFEARVAALLLSEGKSA